MLTVIKPRPLQEGDLVVLDPGHKEEASQSGRLTVVVNAHKEVCAVHKLDGVPLPASMVRLCQSVAAGVAAGRGCCTTRSRTVMHCTS